MAATSNLYSMFPMVEKTYRVRITEDIERDLRFLGQSRVDALTSDFDMSLVKEKPNLKIYELAEQEFFTMKGVTTVNAPIGELMNMLKMESTSKLRDTMGDIFGSLFLDAVMLYKAKDTPARMNESLSVNWMAMQSAKPHLPHRDYVFLRYGDVFEKNGSFASNDGSGLYTGATIWESIELDGCAPLPATQNVVRMRLRRCGIVVEELNQEDLLKISFYISEAHPGRAAVSSITKQWMTKMVSCVVEISNIMVVRSLASQQLLTKQQFVKDGVCCFLCVKAFSLLRRKHHCRVCGDVVCSKCSEMKNLKQGGLNKEVRVCLQCRSTTATTSRSSSSDSRSGRTTTKGSNSKPSFSSFSVTSSEDPPVYMSEDDGYQPMPPSVIHEHPTSNSVSSETRRPKTHPSAIPSGRSRLESDTAKAGIVRHGSRGPSDIIMLNTMKQGSESRPEVASDMILLNGGKHKMISNSAMDSAFAPGYGVHPHAPAGMSEDEIASMELAATVRENTPFSYALNYASRQDWPKAPVPVNEAQRLQKVRTLRLIDPDRHFQEICEYAAAELGCQIASICFIGDKSCFFLAKTGVETRELPRGVLLDAHAVMSEDPMIILDASEDIRFAHNPLVVEEKVRFYAGFPLITSDGFIVGTFSVADPFARECLNGDKYFFLKNLADVAVRGVEQNSIENGSQELSSVSNTSVSGPAALGQPSDMNLTEAHMTMQELLRTAYSTQCQVRMQVNPLDQK